MPIAWSDVLVRSPSGNESKLTLRVLGSAGLGIGGSGLGGHGTVLGSGVGGIGEGDGAMPVSMVNDSAYAGEMSANKTSARRSRTIPARTQVRYTCTRLTSPATLSYLSSLLFIAAPGHCAHVCLSAHLPIIKFHSTAPASDSVVKM